MLSVVFQGGVMFIAIILNVIMQSFECCLSYAEGCNAGCGFAGCGYAERPYAESFCVKFYFVTVC